MFRDFYGPSCKSVGSIRYVSNIFITFVLRLGCRPVPVKKSMLFLYGSKCGGANSSCCDAYLSTSFGVCEQYGIVVLVLSSFFRNITHPPRLSHGFVSAVLCSVDFISAITGDTSIALSAFIAVS